MRAIPFKGQNMVLAKPDSMTDDECYKLPGIRITNGKYETTESVWQISDEELEVINRTKKVVLGVLGKGHPPVYIEVIHYGGQEPEGME